MILFFVRGEVDSDKYIKFCYENYKNLMSTDTNKLPNECNIIRDKDKKPRLDIDNVYFNLSHSHGVCVLAMSDSEIGVDIEKVREIDYNKFDFIDAEDLEDFFEKWVQRESYLKFTGAGLSKLRIEIPNDAHFEFFPVYNEYIVCVCAKEQNIRAFEMDINAI